MTKPDLLLLGPYPDWDLEALAARFTLHRLAHPRERGSLPPALLPALRAIATRGETGADAALMDMLPNLEIIACYAVGTDAVDLAHARARGIRVTNTPDVLTEDVADLGIALLLATARRIVAGDAFVRSGAWAEGPFPLNTRFFGKRLGIVGLGRIGRAVARRAEGFGMRIAYCSRTAKPDVAWGWQPDPASLARESDFLIACAAGGEGTRGMINARVFEALGPQGIFVNIARGTVVDEAALLAALRTRGIAGAGLDVFLNEPRIDPAFATLDNVVLHPHNASGTVETRKAMGRLMRENLEAHFDGRPLLTPVV